MAVAEFAHLHLHTEYSLLDGMGRTQEYVARAKELGIHHLAISDHGVLYGAMEWYHLLLLAENDQGYRNLLNLSSKSHLQGYYYRPRIDLEMLAEHHEGLIATSACLGGPVANNFLHGRPEVARDYAGRLAEIFGPGRFFIELQD